MLPRAQPRSFYAAQTLEPSKWTLTDDYLPDDLTISSNGSARVVRICTAAFVHADPQVVRLDGVRGRFFSRRLHHQRDAPLRLHERALGRRLHCLRVASHLPLERLLTRRALSRRACGRALRRLRRRARRLRLRLRLVCACALGR